MNDRATFIEQIVAKLDEADWLEREANGIKGLTRAGRDETRRKAAALRTDTTPYLVFADWLEEQGDPQHELIRVSCEKLAMPEPIGLRQHGGRMTDWDERAARWDTLKARERELQAQFNPFSDLVKVEWDRGLMVGVESWSGGSFLRDANDFSIWRLEPIRTIVLRDWHGIARSLPPKPLEALPWLRELRLSRSIQDHGDFAYSLQEGIDAIQKLFGTHPQYPDEPRVRVTFH